MRGYLTGEKRTGLVGYDVRPNMLLYLLLSIISPLAIWYGAFGLVFDFWGCVLSVLSITTARDNVRCATQERMPRSHRLVSV